MTEISNENVIEKEVFIWPDPIVEDFNDSLWPPVDLIISLDNIQDDNSIGSESSNNRDILLRESPRSKVIEKWVLDNQKIYLRLVTWNLCAKPPPSIDLVTVNLLPRNKLVNHIY